MTPEQQSRLDRQCKLGRDNGMRLKLRWESGFTVTVFSWEAAAAITGKSKYTMRVYWHDGRLAEGLMSINPSSMRPELCFFTEEQKARRGAKPDKPNQIRKLEEQLAKAEAKVLSLKKQIVSLQINTYSQRKD
jgi:hypothetical protein